MCRMSLMVVVLSASLVGQNPILTLTTTGCCIGADGWMWDVTAQQDIQICLLEVCLVDGLHDVEIYTRFGTHVGQEGNMGSWNLEGEAQAVRAARGGGLTKIPIHLDLTLFQNERLSFYVTTSVAGGIQGNPCLPGGLTGTTGQVRTSNPDLNVFWGTVVPNAFSATNLIRDRVPSHAFHYVTSPTRRQCVHFQRNTDRAKLNLTDITSTVTERRSDGFRRADYQVPHGGLFDLIVESTNFGGVFDIIASPAPLAPVTDPDAPTNTPGGQIVNLDLQAPIFSLFGGPPGNFVPLPPPGPFGNPLPGLLTLPAPNVDLTASAQMMVPDMTQADGISLSQGVQVEVRQDPGHGPAGPILNGGTNLNLGDDDFATAAIGFPFDFYGQQYTEVGVTSNGELRFDFTSGFAGPATPFSMGETIANGAPVIAPWAHDWDPSSGGTVEFGTNGQDMFQVAWRNVPEFGGPATATFGVTVDAASDVISFDYDPSSTPTSGTVGISGGSTGEFPTSYNVSLAGPNARVPLAPGDSPYEWFLNPGMPLDLVGRSVRFEGDGNGNYLWLGF